MNQSRRIVVIAVSALAGGSLLALGGCSSGGGHLSKFRSNPTPELHSLGLRKVEVDNRTTITFNTNSRALEDDLRRVFLVDRPSRLTGHPAMY